MLVIKNPTPHYIHTLSSPSPPPTTDLHLQIVKGLNMAFKEKKQLRYKCHLFRNKLDTFITFQVNKNNICACMKLWILFLTLQGGQL